MFLKHIYSDNVKVETKYVYELLSVSFGLLMKFSSLIDSAFPALRRNVNRFWHNTSQLTLSARFLSTQTNSTANVSKKPVYSSLRKVTTKFWQAQDLKILIKRR
jgi:hypothetical protein